jgi:guanylate kinase
MNEKVIRKSKGINMDRKGILVVVSGFSGAGKGTLMQQLLKTHEQYALSVSATTRNPRPGEEDGIHYFFKTQDEFEKMIAEDALIEYACYVNHYYGTPKDYVENQLDAGKDVILEIEIQGALKIKEKYPDAVLVFVTTPNAGELEHRLTGRGTEDPEVIASRLRRACEESKGMNVYDYLLINDDLEACAERLHGIMTAEHMKAYRQQNLITQIQNELQEFERR